MKKMIDFIIEFGGNATNVRLRTGELQSPESLILAMLL